MFCIYKAVIYKIDLYNKTIDEDLYGYYENREDAIAAWQEGMKHCYEEDGITYQGAVHMICVNRHNER